MRKYIYILTIMLLFSIILIAEEETISKEEIKEMLKSGQSVPDSLLLESYKYQLIEEIKQDSIVKYEDSIKYVITERNDSTLIEQLKLKGFTCDSSLSDFQKLFPSNNFGVNRAMYEYNLYTSKKDKMKWFLQCYRQLK